MLDEKEEVENIYLHDKDGKLNKLECSLPNIEKAMNGYFFNKPETNEVLKVCRFV